MKTIPLEQKHQERTAPQNRDEQQIQKTCFQMMRYISDSKDIDLEGTKKLIDNMQRSILCLQRKKQSMIEKRSRM